MESLGTFYEDERRTDSRELRFGLNWRSTAMPMFEFSVFWLEVTEELCALRSPIRDVVSDGPVSRFIVGIPPHTNPQKLRDEEVTVEVLANLTEKEVLDRLGGWEAHNADPDGFDWLRRIVAT